MKPVLIALFAAAAGGAALAQPAQPPVATRPAPFEPHRIPAPGGEVIIASAGEQGAYNAYTYAPARRVGDMLYVSGVIAGKQPGVEGGDIEAYKAGLRQAFRRLERTLKAAGTDFDNVVMINSFHVFDSPHFSGTRDEHFAAVLAVKAEFMKAPHPAWTAVGTTGLLSDQGLVEIQLIARVPPRIEPLG